MPLDTDFIWFSREMKPTKQCKISQKNLRSDQREGRSHHRPPPLNTPLEVLVENCEFLDRNALLKVTRVEISINSNSIIKVHHNVTIV